MTILLVLVVFITFLTIDFFKNRLGAWRKTFVFERCGRGTQYTTPGFELLGALAQGGGTPMQEQVDWEI